MSCEVYGVIYKIENKKNGKVYIGQTTGTFYERYGCGKWWRNSTNHHLKSAAKKYGRKNFEVDEIFDIAYSQEELNRKEKHWISTYRSNDRRFGYNKEDGGADGKPNEEALRKITIANRRTARMQRGKQRPKSVGERIRETYRRKFLEKYPKTYAEKIQNLLDKHQRKNEVCDLEGISEWDLNRIIREYNLNFKSLPSVKGNFGELHHNYGKARKADSKAKTSATFTRKLEERFGDHVNHIDALLQDRVSISEIARRYGACRQTIRRVIEHYGLEKHGLNVKKHKIP